MRSDNLKNHVKSKHEEEEGSRHSIADIGEKRKLDIPTFNGSEFGTGKAKSRATLDKMMQCLNVAVHRRDKIAEDEMMRERESTSEENGTVKFVLGGGQKVNLPVPKTNVYDEVMKYIKPKSLGELWAKGSGDESEEEEEDNDKEKERNDARVLEERFRKLFCQLTRQGKEENRKELILLLDEMLRKEFITKVEHRSLSDFLTLSSASGDSTANKECLESESENEESSSTELEQENLIQSTIDYLTKHDKEELKGLMQEIEVAVGEEFVTELQDLVDKFLISEYLDGELILPKILEIVKSIENSPIPLSKQQRLKILLNDIDENRYRVKSILTRLGNARDEGDVANIAKQLVQEELLSLEQYKRLVEEEDIELPTIVSIIKETKVGQGIKFLPRKMKDLKRKLELILAEVTSTGIDAMKKELVAILDELLRQNGITPENHDIIKNATL